MKTVRGITGKPGRMCNERRERGTERGEKGGDDEKEVIRGLKYSEGKHTEAQQTKRVYQEKKCVKLTSDEEERYDGCEVSQTCSCASVFQNFMSDDSEKNSRLGMAAAYRRLQVGRD